MIKRSFVIICLLMLNSAFYMTVPQDIILPAPDRTGGKPLMQALSDRATTRNFSPADLSIQQLSDLLWAGWGINRPAEKKRTAPSARNVQEIDVYVSLKSGLYLYDAEANILKQIHNRDIRAVCGTQDFVGIAPVNLIYVADLSKMGKKEGDEITDSDLLYPWTNTGFIAQNVYLYCASANLGCVVRGLVPRERLAAEMGLRSNQVIILSQTVGMPIQP